MPKKEEDEEYAEEEHKEDDVYEENEVEEELDSDEISEKEAGFMEGYDREAEKEDRKRPKRKGRG